MLECTLPLCLIGQHHRVFRLTAANRGIKKGHDVLLVNIVYSL